MLRLIHAAPRKHRRLKGSTEDTLYLEILWVSMRRQPGTAGRGEQPGRVDEKQLMRRLEQLQN